MRERCRFGCRRRLCRPTAVLLFLSLPLFQGVAVVLLLVVQVRAAATSCPFPCQNGGDCRENTFTTEGGQGGEGGEDKTKGQVNNNNNGGFYCHCPRGYFGPSCEINYELCASQNDTCFNGDACFRDVDQDGIPYYHCQCNVHSSDMSEPYAIRFCQHAATSFCTKDLDHNSFGPAGGSYCNSAGKCKPPRNDTHTHHAGCVCPDEWTGSHCEIPIGYEDVVAQISDPSVASSKRSSSSADESSYGSRTWYILNAVASFFILFLMLLAVLFLVYHGTSGYGFRRQQQEQRSPGQRSRGRKHHKRGTRKGGRHQVPQDEDAFGEAAETELTTREPYHDKDEEEDEAEREVI